ncbi:hypothetical protein H310_14331 [Aphanomyces invadans]|uniref:Uncharacterized protein n=1 Tax=Aphanomyces invadans TaxID=157072 RepID=A0A024TAD8_9STRA|nr:hypothetical protein H310_14331 [Aphanomyces invadans]ETV90998.1 hypothetical protein H310_14331 [Aphanomyces invadans]|eukprot:XP_008880387.1 hypothetical protein H310_14331 [Aphanomyces invadans]
MRDDDGRPTVTTMLLEHVLPSPTGRDCHEHMTQQPVIFPGSPVWQNTPPKHSMHNRGGRHRSHDRHKSAIQRPTPARADVKGDEWEYVVVFVLVGVLWAIGVCVALYILRFPFRVYCVQATLIVFAPLMPLYWIVQQLFRCASRIRSTMDDAADIKRRR